MKKYTLYSIIGFPLIIILLTALIIISFHNNSFNTVEKMYSSYFANTHLEYNKKIVTNLVKNIKEIIDYENENIEQRVKRVLRDKLEIALKIVQNIYKNNNEKLSKKEIRKIVINRLAQLRFNNEEGYYFIYDSKTNHIVGHVIEKLIGVDFTDFKDLKGNATIATFKESLKTKYFTFDKLYFYKPNDTITQYPKLVSTFEFKELDLIIGTGEYLNNVTNNLKKEYLKKIQTMQDTQKINIYIRKDEKVFVNIVNNEIASNSIVNNLSEVITTKEKYYQYNDNGREKKSYFYYSGEWGWIIESGFYIDDTINLLSKIKNEIDIKKEISKRDTEIFIFMILLITVIISILFLNNLKNTINQYTIKLKEYINLIDKNVITSSTDINGKIIKVSEAFCKITGYDKDELLGKNHNIVRHEDTKNELYRDLWNTIKSKRTWKGEIKNKKKDGTFYWVEAIINPNLDKNNNIIGYTSIRQDITDKKRVEELSITDGLTTLYNRRHFDEFFPRTLNTARREKEYFSFILMDIDHFKQYNDTYGHQKGDEVLINVSLCLKKSMKRASDMIFRLGGEEFGVLFKSNDKEKALCHANTLRKEIEKLEIIHEKNSASNYVTMSIGLICDSAENLPSFDKVYHQADDLLYQAKESGRNKVVSNN